MRYEQATRRSVRAYLDDGSIVEAYEIIGSPIFTIKAWRPLQTGTREWVSMDGLYPKTVTHFNGLAYGRIGSDPNGALFDHLPVGEARLDAVEKAYHERYHAAYGRILEAFGDSIRRLYDAGRWNEASYGEITIHGNVAELME